MLRGWPMHLTLYRGLCFGSSQTLISIRQSTVNENSSSSVAIAMVISCQQSLAPCVQAALLVCADVCPASSNPSWLGEARATHPWLPQRHVHSHYPRGSPAGPRKLLLLLMGGCPATIHPSNPAKLHRLRRVPEQVSEQAGALE